MSRLILISLTLLLVPLASAGWVLDGNVTVQPNASGSGTGVYHVNTSVNTEWIVDENLYISNSTHEIRVYFINGTDIGTGNNVTVPPLNENETINVELLSIATTTTTPATTTTTTTPATTSTSSTTTTTTIPPLEFCTEKKEFAFNPIYSTLDYVMTCDPYQSLNMYTLNISYLARLNPNMTPVVCNATHNIGAIYYDASDNRHRGCNSSHWNPFW